MTMWKFHIRQLDQVNSSLWTTFGSSTYSLMYSRFHNYVTKTLCLHEGVQVLPMVASH